MTSPDSEYLRIVDVDLNRIGEGLRFLEDLARLILNDVGLTSRLKTMRHDILESTPSLNRQLLQARNAKGDVGIDLEDTAGTKRELPTMIVANSRRVQESLRTIEELAKMPDAGLDPEKFKQARFDLYTIERDLMSRLLRQDKVKRLAGLCVIIDAQVLTDRSPVDVTRQVVDGGAKIIQLRDKIHSKREILPVAESLKSLCAEHDELFIIDDHLDLALAVDADGLHLESDDIPVVVARRLLPIDKILGCTVSTAAEAAAARSDGADYVMAVSVSEVRQAVDIPVVAAGGITVENAAEVVAAGATAVAATEAVLQADSPEEAAREIVERLERGEIDG
jgi:thiamine-phosphate pyrophosphorylase